ncbi:MAG: VIT1/CCC1 transporter family protein [Candidatus Paceibacterota bacterium]
MRSFGMKSGLFVRNLVFGVEDGLVSTVGLLSGIAIAGVDRETIFLTGVVLVFVEAFSMAAGSFLSEASVEEMGGGVDDTRGSIEAGAVMFVSYFAAGLVPLFPYLLFHVAAAFIVSVACSVFALFMLGYWSGRNTRSAWRKSIRMGLVGGLAIVVGALAGTLVSM